MRCFCQRAASPQRCRVPEGGRRVAALHCRGAGRQDPAAAGAGAGLPALSNVPRRLETAGLGGLRGLLQPEGSRGSVSKTCPPNRPAGIGYHACAAFSSSGYEIIRVALCQPEGFCSDSSFGGISVARVKIHS